MIDTEDSKFFYKKIKSYPLLKKHEEVELGQIIQSKLDGWESAREKLFLSNIRLVINIANKFPNKNCTKMDLIQEGMFGLLVACNKFDPGKGFRFSTYATFWIRQNIIKYLQNNVIVRIPVNILNDVKNIRKYINDFNKLNGFDPSYKEVSNKLGLTEKKVEKYLNYLQLEPVYLQDLMKSESSYEPSDSSDGLSSSEHNMLCHDIDKSLSILTPVEKFVLTRRFGINNKSQETLETLSNETGYCPERIRQIERLACKKLRNNENTSQLKVYLVG